MPLHDFYPAFLIDEIIPRWGVISTLHAFSPISLGDKIV